VLERGKIGWHLLARLGTDHQRDEQFPRAVAGEVDRDCESGSFLVEWINGHLDGGADGSVGAADSPGTRRRDVGDDACAAAVGAADAARGAADGPDSWRGWFFEVTLNNSLLPFVEPGGVGDVGEDVRRGAIEVDGRDRRRHQWVPTSAA